MPIVSPGDHEKATAEAKLEKSEQIELVAILDQQDKGDSAVETAWVVGNYTVKGQIVQNIHVDGTEGIGLASVLPPFIASS